MGLLELFGKGQLSEKKIGKAAKLATNPFAQSDIRMREMQRLLDDNTDAALRGAIKRFAANAQGHIADEDEKKWLEDALVERGEAVVGPLRAFITENEQLTYALRAYRRICGDEEAGRLCLEVLEGYGPDDHRSVEAKLQLVWHLGDGLASGAVMEALCPFLRDHSDDVSWAVLDLLDKAADDGRLPVAVKERVCEQLAYLVTDEDTGPRMQRRAVELLAAREWPVRGETDTLASPLAEEFFLDKKRFVRRRVKRV